jgi:hypothetical protein
MRRLIAGPWVGELGWELLSWQGFLRKAAANYDDIVVSTYEGHEPLYRDFCSTFFPHNLKGDRDCLRLHGYDRAAYDALKAVLSSLKGDFLCPVAAVPKERQQFITYGFSNQVPVQDRADVLIHARHRSNRNPSHNWPEEKWKILCEALWQAGVKVAAVGTSLESLCPSGTFDKRNIPMHELMNMMAAAKVVVGPSSGPMHLASLCGAPHVVWTDTRVQPSIGATNKERYEKLWNPLKTPCTVLDMGWQPLVEPVLAAVLDLLQSRK